MLECFHRWMIFWITDLHFIRRIESHELSCLQRWQLIWNTIFTLLLTSGHRPWSFTFEMSGIVSFRASAFPFPLPPPWSFQHHACFGFPFFFSFLSAELVGFYTSNGAGSGCVGGSFSPMIPNTAIPEVERYPQPASQHVVAFTNHLIGQIKALCEVHSQSSPFIFLLFDFGRIFTK